MSDTEFIQSHGATSAPHLAGRRDVLGKSRLINRNVNAVGGRTSMRLEPEVWDAIREICLRDDIDLGEMIQRIERAEVTGGRTSAVRVYVLEYFRAAANEDGHQRAGHGTQDGLPRYGFVHGPALRTVE